MGEMGNSHFRITLQVPLNQSGVCLCDRVFGEAQAHVIVLLTSLCSETMLSSVTNPIVEH